jgi:hypothetical protein
MDAQYESDQDQERNNNFRFSATNSVTGVTAMLRVGSFLMMMILLTMPMVRDCCLPIAHALPCHESKHADDETCFSNQQAIAETKGVVAFKITLNHWVPSVVVLHSDDFPLARLAPNEVARAHTPDVTDLYLHTGALLI